MTELLRFSALVFVVFLAESCMSKKVKTPDELPDTVSQQTELAPILKDELAGQQQKGGFAVIGDSFSVGTMSNTSLGDTSGILFDDFFPIASYIRGVETGTNPESGEPGELVDESFKKNAYNAFSSPGIESLAVRLKFEEDSVQNLSVSGASLLNYKKSIEPQIKNLRSDHSLIIVEIGTSDYCQESYRSEDFQKNYQMMIDEIFKKSESLKKLVLLPVFPVFRLADLSESVLIDFSKDPDPLQKFISEMVFNGGKKELKCHQAHRVFCRPIVEKTREENWSRWESVNQAIFAVVEKIREKNKKTEVIYPEELARASRMSKELISMDCFHPGKKFHENFARDLLSKIPAEEPPGKIAPVEEKK